jgi:hypothetical protein
MISPLRTGTGILKKWWIKMNFIINSGWEVSCCVYAASSYFVLMLRKINFIPLYRPLINFGARLAKNRKKIIFVGAFLMLVDEVADNIFTHNKKEQLKDIIFGNSPVKGKLKLLRYISQELINMGADLRPIPEWAEAEEKNCNGIKDPEGLCFRKYGMSCSVNLMVWTINGNNREKDMLEKAALLVQMTDDVLDIKEDKKNQVNTPAIQGTWNEKTIKKQFIDMRETIFSTVKSQKKSRQIEKAINWKMNWLITAMQENG